MRKETYEEYNIIKKLEDCLEQTEKYLGSALYKDYGKAFNSGKALRKEFGIQMDKCLLILVLNVQNKGVTECVQNYSGLEV